MLAALGLTPEDFGDQCISYWPEHAQAVQMFCRVGTQWRIGMNGPTGLDYPALYPLMDRLNLSDSNWDWLLLDIQEMESSALQTISENREQKS